MRVKQVLVIGNDYQSMHVWREMLEPGVKVQVAQYHDEALHKLRRDNFDLILLVFSSDPLWSITSQKLYQFAEPPVLLVFEAEHEQYIRPTLRHGADDFIIHPFNKATLCARIYLMLIHRTDLEVKASPPLGNSALDTIVDDGHLFINLKQRRVNVAGQRAILTSAEYEILACLVRHAGQVLTYSQIIEQVWGWKEAKSNTVLHTYISHLRTKLEQDRKRPCYIHTQYGVGYYFATNTQSVDVAADNSSSNLSTSDLHGSSLPVQNHKIVKKGQNLHRISRVSQQVPNV